MANKPWLLTECVRNAWSALNENAPLRRNVLGTILFLTLFCIALAAFGIEMGGLALERSMGFVALAPWFLVDACLTALICCATAVLLALVYRCFIAPQPETGATGLGGDGAESTQEQPTFSA